MIQAKDQSETVTRQEIAEWLGVTTRTVDRKLADLQAADKVWPTSRGRWPRRKLRRVLQLDE